MSAAIAPKGNCQPFWDLRGRREGEALSGIPGRKWEGHHESRRDAVENTRKEVVRVGHQETRLTNRSKRDELYRKSNGVGYAFDVPNTALSAGSSLSSRCLDQLKSAARMLLLGRIVCGGEQDVQERSVKQKHS